MSSNIDLIKLAYENKRIDLLTKKDLVTKIDGKNSILDVIMGKNDINSMDIIRKKYPEITFDNVNIKVGTNSNNDILNRKMGFDNIPSIRNELDTDNSNLINESQIIRDLNQNTSTFKNRFMINNPDVVRNIKANANEFDGTLDKKIDINSLTNNMTSVPDINSIKDFSKSITTRLKDTLSNIGDKFNLTGGGRNIAREEINIKLHRIVDILMDEYGMNRDKAIGMRKLIKDKIINEGGPTDNDYESDIVRLNLILKFLENEKNVKKFIKESEKNGKLEDTMKEIAQRELERSKRKLEEIGRNKRYNEMNNSKRYNDSDNLDKSDNLDSSKSSKSSTNKHIYQDNDGFLNDEHFDIINDIAYNDESLD